MDETNDEGGEGVTAEDYGIDMTEPDVRTLPMQGGNSRWSIEENGCIDTVSLPSTSQLNGFSSNHVDQAQSGASSSSPGSMYKMLNNNLIKDQCNFTCDDKTHRLYHKFTPKVNNNVYENGLHRDGMNDYFLNHIQNGRDTSSSVDKKLNGYPEHLNGYPDHLNLLNGEYDDEDDGCIYTYKGENYEANLSHLMDTCLSCGLPNLERRNSNRESRQEGMHFRLPNGERRPSNGPQHNNLFSPEMDFLEMDFDPESNGDCDVDSDCEDNCVLDCDNSLSLGLKYSNGDVSNEGILDLRFRNHMEKKTNNIVPENRRLLCRRCKTSESDVKLDNVDGVNNPSLVLNLENSSFACLDDRPQSKNSLFNVPTTSENLQFSKEDKINNLKEDVPQLSSNNLAPQTNNLCPQQSPNNLAPQSADEDCNDGDSVENNLAEDDFSDEGEEADDERDDSNSECQVGLACSKNTISESSLYDLGDFNTTESIETLGTSRHNSLDAASDSKPSRFPLNDLKLQNGCHLSNTKLEFSNAKTLFNSNININNNNLGSTSAPEVSPALEYGPLEKFGRSISFHNQLSSPKYENICFPPKSKSEDSPRYELCNTPGCDCVGICSQCNIPSSHSTCYPADIANIEACVHRLNQRENSVFNILSDYPSSKSQNNHLSNTSNQIDNTKSQHTNGLGNCDSSSSPSHCTLGHCNISSLKNTTNSFDTNLLNSPSRATNKRNNSLLPQKSSLTKTEDPNQDPNTASNKDDLSLNHKHNCNEGTQGGIEKTMIWTERQATLRQVSQIGTSACGATAVVNVLSALDRAIAVEKVAVAVPTRLRAENAPLVEYLESRSVAGCTHEGLVSGVETLSEGEVVSKFFHMFPKRAVQLSRWLAQWIQKGGVPVATLNLQVGVSPGETIPDAWHHQMIFGVGPQGIYLTNPLECVSDSLLADQLCSESVLLVRRLDIVNRWSKSDSVARLATLSDTRWKDMNVLGEVVGVLKEQAAPPMLQGRRHLTSHVAIPAAYKSGVTIFMRKDNPHAQDLLSVDDLPLLE